MKGRNLDTERERREALERYREATFAVLDEGSKPSRATVEAAAKAFREYHEASQAAGKARILRR